MGLRDGYGFLLGTLADYRPDDPNDYGLYMHGVLTVATPAGRYTCAVDVDTQHGAIPVQWRIQPLRSAEWAALFALPDGWHPLASMPSTGAVDYIRDPRLYELIYVPEYVEGPLRFPFPPEAWPGFQLPHQRPMRMSHGRSDLAAAQTHSRPRGALVGIEADVLRTPVGGVSHIVATTLRQTNFSSTIISLRSAWNAGASAQALVDLQAVISNPQRVMIFGEPFTAGRGVHNIHQNQGDRIGGGHDMENAIWQDGITIAFRADGTASAFMNKFSTQADATDNNGHPLP